MLNGGLMVFFLFKSYHEIVMLMLHKTKCYRYLDDGVN